MLNAGENLGFAITDYATELSRQMYLQNGGRASERGGSITTSTATERRMPLFEWTITASDGGKDQKGEYITYEHAFVKIKIDSDHQGDIEIEVLEQSGRTPESLVDMIRMHALRNGWEYLGTRDHAE